MSLARGAFGEIDVREIRVYCACGRRRKRARVKAKEDLLILTE